MQSDRNNHAFNLNDFSAEMLMKFFSYLSPENIVLLKQVNKYFQTIADIELLWRQKHEIHFGHRKSQDKNNDNINGLAEFCIAYNDEYPFYKKNDDSTNNNIPDNAKRKLFSLVKEGDIEGLKSILTFNDLSLRDKNGKTLIDWAKKKNNQALLNAFYKLVITAYQDRSGITVDTFKRIDPEERTILDWAILCRQSVDIIELLIFQGVDEQTLNNGLQLAAEDGLTEIAECLINHGANINTIGKHGGTPLLVAIENDHKNIVDVLLKHNADITIRLNKDHDYHKQFDIVVGDSPLRAAIKLGRKEVVKDLLDKGADINEIGSDDHNPLRLAAKGGQAEIVELLISRGADINAPSRLGATPLLFAIENGHKHVVDVLLKHNADITIPLQSDGNYHKKFNVVAGDTPLRVAIKLGHKEIVKGLLDKGADINEIGNDGHNALRLAAENGQAEIVELLISRGADVNARSRLGATSLIFAIEQNHKRIVDILLKHNADVSIPLESDGNYHKKFNVLMGDTPLRAAIKLGQPDIVQLLLPKINNINSLNAALRLAAELGKAEIVDLLITHGADVNTRTTSGATSLILAIEHGHKMVVDVLLKHNANITIPLQKSTNYHDIFNVVAGDTPLRAAIKRGHKEIVKDLLDQGADVNEIGSDSQNALHLAAIEGKAEIVDLLITHGADVNIRGALGATPLLLAIEHGHKKVVHALLKHNADITAPLETESDYHKKHHVVVGDTPLHAAARLGSTSIMRQLMARNANITAINSQQQTPLDLVDKTSRCASELQLLAAAAKINHLPDDYRKTVSIAGHTLFKSGPTGKQLKEAASALKEVIFNGANKSSLKPHKNALNSDELKPIYHNLRIK